LIAVRHAFTVDEWYRMGDAGLFGEKAGVELLDGAVIEMAPIARRFVHRGRRAQVQCPGMTTA
jgi:hypothetical protein